LYLNIIPIFIIQNKFLPIPILGIGRDLCIRLHSLGATVIAVSRSPQPLADLQRSCPGTQTISVDLSDWQATRTALKSLPPLDGLVNNAGTAIIKPFNEFSEKDFDDTINVNLKAAFNVSQIAVPLIRPGGSIVNISSLAALSAMPGHATYSISKAGIDGLTRSLALELADRKILTRMGRKNWSDPAKAGPLLARIPMGWFGEVVNSICFLLSDQSSYINGHSLPIEGGYRAN
jgi:L-xylulose reductase